MPTSSRVSSPTSRRRLVGGDRGLGVRADYWLLQADGRLAPLLRRDRALWLGLSPSPPGAAGARPRGCDRWRGGSLTTMAGEPESSRLPRQMFDHFFVTRQAVEDGLGIGVGPLPMLEIDIASGRLMVPLPHIRVPRTGYVAVIPRQADPGNMSAGFVDWLAGEAQGQAGVTVAG